MNLMFLVEGEKTETKLYSKWLKRLFPQLSFVAKPEDMTTHCCRIISGNGYPNMVYRPRANRAEPSRLEALIKDIKILGNIDHFFICVDSEEYTYQERFNEVKTKLEQAKIYAGIDNTIKTTFHIIIQHCCIETWALGNARLPHKYTCTHNSLKLTDFQKFYDILIADPELMSCCPPKHHFRTKAKFHEQYLREYLKEYGLKYKKKDPESLCEKEYFDALKERCLKTEHLASLKVLLDILENMTTD